jgi:hypothetical protein
VTEELGDGAPETIRTSDLCLRRATDIRFLVLTPNVFV